jgi:DNA-binding GntR family transcriptional regulator
VRRSWEDIQKLARILEEGNLAIELGKFESLVELNSELHMALVASSGNRNLVTLHEQIQAKAQWVYSVGLDDRAAESWHEHEEIVAAVASGEPVKAGELAQMHIAQATDHYKTHAQNEDLLVPDTSLVPAHSQT